jgi:hypothetical protein
MPGPRAMMLEDASLSQRPLRYRRHMHVLYLADRFHELAGPAIASALGAGAVIRREETCGDR